MKKWVWGLVLLPVLLTSCGFPAVYRDSAGRFYASGYANTGIKIVSNASGDVEIFINEKKEGVLKPGDFQVFPPTAVYNTVIGRALTVNGFKFSAPKEATIQYYGGQTPAPVPYMTPPALYFTDNDFPALLIASPPPS